jgi:hypothetical protein
MSNKVHGVTRCIFSRASELMYMSTHFLTYATRWISFDDHHLLHYHLV